MVGVQRQRLINQSRPALAVLYSREQLKQTINFLSVLLIMWQSGSIGMVMAIKHGP